MTLAVPAPDEYTDFQADYVARAVALPDVRARLSEQRAELAALLAGISEVQAEQRPTPNDWTLKEVLGHLSDFERVFSYRALRFSRRDPAALPGFDQEDYVREASFNTRSLADLLDEFDHLRAATVRLFAAIPEDRWMQRGTASGGSFTLRAMLYITVGHLEQHLASLREQYLPALR